MSNKGLHCRISALDGALFRIALLFFFTRPQHYISVTRLRMHKKVVFYRYVDIFTILLVRRNLCFLCAQEQARAAGSIIDEALGAIRVNCTRLFCKAHVADASASPSCTVVLNYAICGAAQPRRALRRKQSSECVHYTQTASCERLGLPQLLRGRLAMSDRELGAVLAVKIAA